MRRSGHRVIGSSGLAARRPTCPGVPWITCVENPLSFGARSTLRLLFRARSTLSLSFRAQRGICCSIFATFLVLASTESAQTPNVRVRLYSLHSEHRIKITARSGELSWRSCEHCAANHAIAVIVETSPDGLKIQGQGAKLKKIYVEGDYKLEPSEGLALALSFPLEVIAEQQRLKVLATLPLEDYVAAALAGEGGDFQQAESLKAMAVAVRSYAVRFRSRHANEGFDFCDSTHCQALNLKAISSQVRAAVAATRGEMLWHQGSPAATFYHQNCGGMLAAAQESWPRLREPYLKQQADPYCVRSAMLPWKAEIGRKELESALRAQGIAVPSVWSSLEIVARTPSGRVSKLAFRGGPGDPRPPGAYSISASTLRFAIGRTLGWNQVRSDLYETETTGERIVFRGRGAGHGIGLCQAGAEEMAKESKDYRQILAFYYPGTSLGLNARGLAWQKSEGERFVMLSTQPDQDAVLLRAAERILPVLESDLGWKLDFKPQLKVYPTLDTYRDSTGQPGWIAAFTRGHNISLQPLAVLQKKSILDSTLRHEFTHLLIELRAHPGTALWFREGLVLYFADAGHHSEPVQMTEAEMEKTFSQAQDRQELERAYAAAKTKVGEMVAKNGKETVLLWLTLGPPPKKLQH